MLDGSAEPVQLGAATSYAASTARGYLPHQIVKASSVGSVQGPAKEYGAEAVADFQQQLDAINAKTLDAASEWGVLAGMPMDVLRSSGESSTCPEAVHGVGWQRKRLEQGKEA